jgi:hypothetical protein
MGKGTINDRPRLGGRPTKYNDSILKKTREYIDSCEDEEQEFHKTRGEKSDSYERFLKVKLPTIEGLALFLKIDKDTIKEWRKIHQEFSTLIEELLDKQAKVLLEKGLSGEYNPTIAKVLLTKHGYREGVDATTDGKAIEAIPVTGMRIIIEK